MEFNTQNLQSVECDNEQTLCRNTTSCINVPAGVSVLNGMYIPGRTIVRRKPGWQGGTPQGLNLSAGTSPPHF